MAPHPLEQGAVGLCLADGPSSTGAVGVFMVQQDRTVRVSPNLDSWAARVTESLGPECRTRVEVTNVYFPTVRLRLPKQ